jgi:hypothetical protein
MDSLWPCSVSQAAGPSLVRLRETVGLRCSARTSRAGPCRSCSAKPCSHQAVRVVVVVVVMVTDGTWVVAVLREMIESLLPRVSG